MSNKLNNKGKHLSYEDRAFIEDALSCQYQLTKIAKYLGKDPTTISKEIKRSRMFKENSSPVLLACKHRKKCDVKHLCNKSCKDICKKCKLINCFRTCHRYEPITCKNQSKYPHVCNGCDTKISCKLKKSYYRAKVADAQYRDNLKSTREGIALTAHEIKHIDNLITPLIKKGHSLSHIYANHANEIGCSERTLYNYFDLNLFTVRNIDLPRKVRYKPRKKIKTKSKDRSYRTLRTYNDFLNYMDDNPDKQVVEMDTVIGRKGGKTFLTMLFRNSSLMLIFLLESCTQECVNNVFTMLYDKLGSENFKSTFEVILTDNGSEFKNSDFIENDVNGHTRTKVFYCDPMASHQKGKLERNHEYIRKVLPKGKSFDNLTQEKVTLLANHINSAVRTSLNRNTPFKLAQFLQDESLLSQLNLCEILPDNVHLKPALFK